MSESNFPNGRATIREVYELLRRVEDKIDEKFDAHLQMHQREHAAAERWIHWAATVVLAVATVAVMIWK